MRDATSKMPPEIGEVYDLLDRELGWYNRTMTVVYELYVDKPGNVDILNAVASDFFGFLQPTLIDSLIAQLGRLTEPASNGSNDNLSFKRLLSLIDPITFPTLHSDVTKHLAEIEAHSTSARKHRHKRVAHADLDVALKTAVLPDIILADFREALTAGRNLLNSVAAHFDGFTVAHKVVPARGGAHSLMTALERAKELKDQDPFKYRMGYERKTMANS